MKKSFFFLILFFFLTSCFTRKENCSTEPRYIDLLNNALSEAIISDGFNPPVASRIYAYCNIVAYEAMCKGDTGYPSLSGKLKAWEKHNNRSADADSLTVMIISFSKVAVEMTYRDYIVENMRDSLLKIRKCVIGNTSYSNSIKEGEQLAKEVLLWASTDNYRQTRDMPRFSPTGITGTWEPTSPTFGEAIEPHWMKVRTMILDSSGEVPSSPTVGFDSKKGSAFYKLCDTTYKALKEETEKKKTIAIFWDCNPQKTNISGHVMYNTRQLTPGGHWIAITQQICRKENFSNAKTAYILALTSIGIADGFKACWNEKYKTNLIRPETYINKYIDAKWKPFLETPLFPEHPSGHSTVSSAAATILENFFGAEYAFMDSAELTFGGGVRSFGNIREAADEAAISRVYGGIHYMKGCNAGITLGNKIGELVLERTGARQQPN